MGADPDGGCPGQQRFKRDNRRVIPSVGEKAVLLGLVAVVLIVAAVTGQVWVAALTIPLVPIYYVISERLHRPSR